ncbi:hypothetical protein C8Q80DRAFT_888963 [Daedaleopsis nitida]|nr:hypothetical protein C8Q80DRAFT_888963 [Daedaleopsis nitida]
MSRSSRRIQDYPSPLGESSDPRRKSSPTPPRYLSFSAYRAQELAAAVPRNHSARHQQPAVRSVPAARTSGHKPSVPPSATTRGPPTGRPQPQNVFGSFTLPPGSQARESHSRSHAATSTPRRTASSLAHKSSVPRPQPYSESVASSTSSSTRGYYRTVADSHGGSDSDSGTSTGAFAAYSADRTPEPRSRNPAGSPEPELTDAYRKLLVHCEKNQWPTTEEVAVQAAEVGWSEMDVLAW